MVLSKKQVEKYINKLSFASDKTLKELNNFLNNIIDEKNREGYEFLMIKKSDFPDGVFNSNGYNCVLIVCKRMYYSNKTVYADEFCDDLYDQIIGA